MVTDLEMILKATDQMGSDFNFHQNAIKLGGGGFAIKKRLLIGGNPSVSILQKSSGNKCEKSIMNQSGYFHISFTDLITPHSL